VISWIKMSFLKETVLGGVARSTGGREDNGDTRVSRLEVRS
jgi:hypothetical protein